MGLLEVLGPLCVYIGVYFMGVSGPVSLSTQLCVHCSRYLVDMYACTLYTSE